MIEEISCIGFRGFQTLQTLKLAQPNGRAGSGLTVLLGPNGGGKSTVIECFRKLTRVQEASFTEGIVSLLFIADALFESNPDELVVIDEPELSLHPQLQRRLFCEMLSYAKDRQIIIGAVVQRRAAELHACISDIIESFVEAVRRHESQP
jgi:predicted ATPase